MTTTAAEVVNAYLTEQRTKNAGERATEAIAKASREIIGELPDGFTAKDARKCVALFLDGHPDLEGVTTNKRGRVTTKTLNDMVNAGTLSLDENGEYRHADPTTAASNVTPLGQP